MINLEKGAPANPITHLPKLELGQKVTIKSLDWYVSKKDYYTGVVKLTAESGVKEMCEYWGKTATIVDVFKDLDGESDAFMYRIDLDHRDWNWTDEMFEPERVEDVKDPEE